MGHARNCIIGTAADALIVIGGGAGTLSEVAVAWTGAAAAAVVVMEGLDGSVRQFAGRALDGRPPLGREVVGAGSAKQAVGLVLGKLEQAGLWMPEQIKRVG